MNITKSTFWFTLAQGILGVLAGSLQDRYPEVAFWSGISVAILGVILLNIKQFGQPKDPTQ
jgi:hypothetical protein